MYSECIKKTSGSEFRKTLYFHITFILKQKVRNDIFNFITIFWIYSRYDTNLSLDINYTGKPCYWTVPWIEVINEIIYIDSFQKQSDFTGNDEIRNPYLILIRFMEEKKFAQNVWLFDTPIYLSSVQFIYPVILSNNALCMHMQSLWKSMLNESYFPTIQLLLMSVI